MTWYKALDSTTSRLLQHNTTKCKEKSIKTNSKDSNIAMKSILKFSKYTPICLML